MTIGFATGILSVFAYENGANEVALHSPSKSSLDLYCIPTIRRNAIPDNKCKFSSGDLSQMRKAIGGKKFDVILGAELLNRGEEEFDMVLQILDEALSHDGICFLSSPTHYFTVNSNLATFIERVKIQRKFDVIERWSSPRTDVVQSKSTRFNDRFTRVYADGSGFPITAHNVPISAVAEKLGTSQTYGTLLWC
uniref:Methyltransf_11 domain-containing protein n=1 Tax=Angiostrongylus cantonensis TaxID=6313 RepID=A0A0K0DHS2_ANGCA